MIFDILWNYGGVFDCFTLAGENAMIWRSCYKRNDL